MCRRCISSLSFDAEPKPRRGEHTVTVPEWRNFGIALQLRYGHTIGQMLAGPPVSSDDVPSEDVLRAAWEAYRDRFTDDPKPWAMLVFDEGVDADEAHEIVGRQRP